MIIVHISATRKNIRWMLKTVNKVKKIIDVVDISEITTNKKNPKFCTVTIRFYRKDKAHQVRARPMMKQSLQRKFELKRKRRVGL